MHEANPLKTAIRAILVAAALGATLPALAGPTTAQVAAQARATAQASALQQGQRALDAGDYARAIAAFSQLHTAGGADADAALYWKAYAELRAGRAVDARSSLDAFHKQFPDSRWARDARALAVDVRTALGKAPQPERAQDEELKLYALDGLMQMEPAKALPILKRFLAGDHPARLKERALFVASQSDLPEAHQLLLQATRDSKDPELQRRAIQMLGVTDDKRLMAELVPIYQSSQDVRVKRAVLDAWMVADDEASLLKAARTEPDTGLRRQAISLLGALDAVPALREMLKTEKEPALRRSIVEAFMIADYEEGLLEVAKSDPDSSLRRHAVQMLGAVDATDSLRGLLRTETDVGVRRAIMEGFMMADDTEGLLEAARTEKDAAVRRNAIHMLGALDRNQVAGSEFERLYRDGTDASQKRAVIEALAVREDATILVKLYRAEQDPQLKRLMVQMLAQMDHPEAEKVMRDILDK